MSANRGKRQLTIRRLFAKEPMLPQDLHATERLLARLVARRYLAARPELVMSQTNHTREEEGEGNDE